MDTSINWELIIALCAVAISVASPVLTSLINGSQESKKFYRENYYEHRAKIIEEYIYSAEKRVAAILSGYAPERYEFTSTNHYYEIHFYVSNSCIKAIDELEAKLNERRLDSVEKRFKDVIECLAKEPPRHSK